MLLSNIQAITATIPPSLLFVLFFGMGIVTQAANLPFTPIALIYCALCIAVYKIGFHEIIAFRLLLICIAFGCGGIRYRLLENAFLIKSQQLCNRKTSASGTILEQRNKNKGCSSILVALESGPGGGNVQIDCSCPIACSIGDTIALYDIYFTAPEPGSCCNYLKKEAILATARAPAQQKFIVFAQPKTIFSRIALKRQELIKSVTNKLSERTFSLVGPIFFGHKLEPCQQIDTLREQFQWWGISHYLARSGLHLVMFMLIIQFLANYAPVSLFLKQWLTMLFMGVYIIFSFSSISFIRSIVMIFAYFLCSFGRVQYHALHTIALAGSIILFHNPYQLFSLDFQLSFALTTALILIKS